MRCLPEKYSQKTVTLNLPANINPDNAIREKAHNRVIAPSSVACTARFVIDS